MRASPQTNFARSTGASITRLPTPSRPGHARQVLIDDQAKPCNNAWLLCARHRWLVDIALQSYAVIKSGQVGATGATGTVLFQTLEELRSLADRTLPEIRRAYEVAIP
jgi:nitrous oxide reductase accessory protein NosL